MKFWVLDLPVKITPPLSEGGGTKKLFSTMPPRRQFSRLDLRGNGSTSRSFTAPLACGFWASLGFAVDLPSGLFLCAIFMLSGSLCSRALDLKRAVRKGFIMELIKNQAPSQRQSALTAWVHTGLDPVRLCQAGFRAILNFSRALAY